MSTVPPTPDPADDSPRDPIDELVGERPKSAAGPHRVEDRLEQELAGARALQAISTRLISEDDQDSLYAQIVEAAVDLMGADFASLQMAEPGGQGLTLLAWRGFEPESARHWHRVDIRAVTSCAMALRSQRRVVVSDVEETEALAGTRELDEYRRSGIRSMQSTVLVSRTGRTLGMLSTHWARPFDLRSGDFRHFDVLARQAADLIERAQTQRELRESEERLREADRRKDEFLATLAHELRNPLAPIRTGLELIRLGAGRPETIEPVRQMMERQVGHMVRLIDDLLDVSRISSGKIRLQRTVASLASLVQGAVEANRAFFDESGVDLEIRLPEEAVWLDVDPTRFVQVLSNILHNAAKFTEAGGRALVSAKIERPPEGRMLALSVSDSGIGISPDMLIHVFELFAQGESPSSRAQTGLGIGLALSRRLVEMHGGTLEAESPGVGQGSTFTIRLAVAEAPDGTRPARPGAAEPSPGGRRVLIVDDNVDAARSLAMLVESAAGGTTRVVHDGRAAEDAALEFRPDLILLDVGMPGLDGYETCRRLRRALPAARIVAVTGWGQPQDRERAFRSGFDEHLTKPADPAAIRELLSESTRS